MFGWKKVKDNTRKYRRVYFFLPRKNGKSILGSGIAIYLLLFDREAGAQVFSAAADREQAGIVFNVAKKMIEASPDLAVLCEAFKKSIVDYESGSSYHVLSSDAPNKHGKNSHGILFDELHTQSNRELWDTLTTSTSARAQPMTVVMTTAGYDKNSICWEVQEYAQGCVDGIIKDDEFLPLLFCASESDDWTDPKVWYKANPNLGVSKSYDYMVKECERAKSSPSYENTFKRLELNIWTEQESRFIQMHKWDECGQEPIDLEGLKNRECYGALDLSSNRDITAFCLAFPSEAKIETCPEDLINGKSESEKQDLYHSLGYNEEGLRIIRTYDAIWEMWVPEEMVKQRQGSTGGGKTITEKDAHRATTKVMRVKYGEWVKDGFLNITSGDVVDYDRVRKRIQELGQIYNIKEIAIDRWNALQISTQLMGDGFTIVPFGQGFASMSAPTKELDTLVLSKRIRHGGNPVIRWMAKNVSVMQDAAGNVKPNKEKSADKIDGIVALIMAIARASVNDSSSVYDDRGLLTTDDY